MNRDQIWPFEFEFVTTKEYATIAAGSQNNSQNPKTACDFRAFSKGFGNSSTTKPSCKFVGD
jgi:hypothetical protein